MPRPSKPKSVRYATLKKEVQLKVKQRNIIQHTKILKNGLSISMMLCLMVN